MPYSTYFVQGCPTCGRRLHVRVEYLGKKVVCQHCCGPFVARDGAGKYAGDAQMIGAESHAAGGEVHSTGALLRRANELLKRAAAQVERGRQQHPK